MKISILMSVYNPNDKYFKLCLDSIEQQSYKDFELILVDDGTTNLNLEEMLSHYSFDYKIIHNSQNLGLARSLNIGMSMCTGEYIARMDDDDIMMPNRLEMQLKYAEENDVVLFSNISLIDDNNNSLSDFNSKIIAEDFDIKKYLLKSGNCLAHSTLFIKTKILKDVKGYDERFVYSQDYSLYLKLFDKYKFKRLSERLVQYRIPFNRITVLKKILTLLSCYAAYVDYLNTHRSAINYWYFVRRSLSLIKMMYVYSKEKHK
ncbi:MAG: glycosyltransferase [Candidatus Cloacimonetes bacterium]|nr:glycosyltransferase [Candidatus Cloacimonadota bacterium]